MPDFRLIIVLDTNILSELMRATPAGAIERWLGEQPAASLFIASVAEAELRYCT
jgi:predicted nucleic acid-binding protein